MKIKELIEKTGFSRQTIHYYLREGLLPQPRKTNATQAEYTQAHVERLLLIKELQERFFLPLNTVRNVISHMKAFERTDKFLRIKAEHLKPAEQFVSETITGEEAFAHETGMTRKRLKDFERFGIISPTLRRNRKVYSQDDISIGKAIGAMRRIGLSHEKGFRLDGLNLIKQEFAKVVALFGEIYVEDGLKSLSAKELEELKKPATEIVAVFLYHLFRRLSREDLNHRMTRPFSFS
jgi:DNA-binding transcriptional MerR regulator